MTSLKIILKRNFENVKTYFKVITKNSKELVKKYLYIVNCENKYLLAKILRPFVEYVFDFRLRGLFVVCQTGFPTKLLLSYPSNIFGCLVII